MIGDSMHVGQTSMVIGCISRKGGRWLVPPATPLLKVRSVDLTRLFGQCAVAANPEFRPQPTPACKPQAVSVSGTGRLPPDVRRAAVNKGQAPSIAVLTRFSSRELPFGEHRDAPVVTTLRGTSSLPCQKLFVEIVWHRRRRLSGRRTSSAGSGSSAGARRINTKPDGDYSDCEISQMG